LGNPHFFSIRVAPFLRGILESRLYAECNNDVIARRLFAEAISIPDEETASQKRLAVTNKKTRAAGLSCGVFLLKW
jgi:hypothetical protein